MTTPFTLAPTMNATPNSIHSSIILGGDVQDNKKTGKKQQQDVKSHDGSKTQDTKVTPEQFMDIISGNVMTDPVIIESGMTYERNSISVWISHGKSTCPMTGLKVNPHIIIPNVALRQLIEEFVSQNQWFKDKWLEAKSDTDDLKKNNDIATWEWLKDEDNDEWVSYDVGETMKRLEDAHKKNKQIVPINGMYVVNVREMKQYDRNTGSRWRKVRRVGGQEPPKDKAIWYYQSDAKTSSRFTLDHYIPMSPEDNNILENEHNKSVEERNMVRIGPYLQFIADVTSMMQVGRYNSRKLVRIE